MKRNSRSLMMAAAMSGLISGAATQCCLADSTNATATNAPRTSLAAGKAVPAKKAPKEQSCAGQNDCKGIGGCKTETHSCKFLNSCKGKGGCEITAKDIKTWEKMQQEAAAKAAKVAAKLAAKAAEQSTNKPAGQ